MYDANEYELQNLQARLDAEGITEDEFDLSNYVGCTYRTLRGLVDLAIINHNKKEETA